MFKIVVACLAVALVSTLAFAQVRLDVPRTCAGFISLGDDANPDFRMIGHCPFYALDAAGARILSTCKRDDYCVVQAIVRVKYDDFYIEKVLSVSKQGQGRPIGEY